MFCTKCGNAIENTAKFCGKCGSPFISREELQSEIQISTEISTKSEDEVVPESVFNAVSEAEAEAVSHSDENTEKTEVLQEELAQKEQNSSEIEEKMDAEPAYEPIAEYYSHQEQELANQYQADLAVETTPLPPVEENPPKPRKSGKILSKIAVFLLIVVALTGATMWFLQGIILPSEDHAILPFEVGGGVSVTKAPNISK